MSLKYEPSSEPLHICGEGHVLSARRLKCHLVAILSHRMYLLISLRKSTPPQNRQLIVYYY